jgi:hypothetical protein
MSPIRPEKAALYPRTWPALSRWVRHGRAGDRCEFLVEGERCTAINGEPHPDTGSRVVLTVSHLDHDPTNSATSNLAAGCQRCHLAYDLHRHIDNRGNVPGQIALEHGTPRLRTRPGNPIQPPHQGALAA